MHIIGAVDAQGMLQSLGSGEPAGKKKMINKGKATTSKAKSHSDKPKKSGKDSKLTKDTTDPELADLDQKWSDWFNCLEALLLAKKLDKEPTFQTVKVAPFHSPPAAAVKSTQPFIRQTDPATTHSSSLFNFARHRLLCWKASVFWQTSN